MQNPIKSGLITCVFFLMSSLAWSKSVNEYIKDLDIKCHDTNFKECVDPLDTPATVHFQEVDLNEDGTNELIVVISGSYRWFGQNGGEVAIFESTEEQYHLVQQITAANIEIHQEKTNGYFNINFTGPGFDHPTWYWNGERYSTELNE